MVGVREEEVLELAMASESDSSAGMLCIRDSGVEEEEEEEEGRGDGMEDETRELEEAPSFISNKDPVSPLVRAFFYSAGRTQDIVRREESKAPANKDGGSSAEIKKRLELMEAEIVKLRADNKKLRKAVKENEKVPEVTNDKNIWEEQKISEMKNFNLFKGEEMMRLKRERMLLERQMKLILQLPTKEERNEIEQVKKKIEKITAENLEKESRWRFMTRRLKRTIQDLNAKISELQAEVKRYERILLAQWDTIKSDRMPLLMEDMKASYVHNRRGVTYMGMEYDLEAETAILSQQNTHLDMCNDNENEKYDPINKPERKRDTLLGSKTCVWATGIKRSNRREKLCNKYKSTEPDCLREDNLENVSLKASLAKNAFSAFGDVNGDREEKGFSPIRGAMLISVL